MGLGALADLPHRLKLAYLDGKSVSMLYLAKAAWIKMSTVCRCTGLGSLEPNLRQGCQKYVGSAGPPVLQLHARTMISEFLNALSLCGLASEPSCQALLSKKLQMLLAAWHIEVLPFLSHYLPSEVGRDLESCWSLKARGCSEDNGLRPFERSASRCLPSALSCRASSAYDASGVLLRRAMGPLQTACMSYWASSILLLSPQ